MGQRQRRGWTVSEGGGRVFDTMDEVVKAFRGAEPRNTDTIARAVDFELS
jgi:hypothetical protein